MSTRPGAVPFGNFAWPSAVDPDTWTGFRPTDESGTRALDEIAPEEIANAMLAVLDEDSDIEFVDDLLRRTAEIFGFSKLGAKVRDRLEAVYETLPTDEDAQGTDDSTSSFAETSARPDGGQPPISTAVDDVAGSSTPAPTVPQLSDADRLHVPFRAGEVIEAAAPPAADPVIDQVAADADHFTPDLSLVSDDAYYDYVAQAPLRTELKRLVNEIVLDPTYDGSPGHEGVGVRAAHLTIDEAHAVGNAASTIWSEAVGSVLSGAAERIAMQLATDPAFDPLPWEDEINAFVASRMLGKRSGLVSLTQRHLNYYAQENGLVARAEAEIQEDARRAFGSMTPLERDAYGFASRNAKRLQLAEPYLDDVKESRRRFVIYWMSRFESEEIGLRREARYATASRRLTAQGQSRAAISRILGISTSTLDRIERENHADIPLPPDDPIFTLAPTLR